MNRILTAVALAGSLAIAMPDARGLAGQAVGAKNARASKPASQRTSARHLEQARKTLNAIEADRVTGNATTRLAELRKRFMALQQTYQAGTTPTTPTTSTTASHDPTINTPEPPRAGAEWPTHYAAIEQILNDLLGTPGATLEASARTRLMEFRKHLSAFNASAKPAQPVAKPAGPGAAAAPGSAAIAAGASASASRRVLGTVHLSVIRAIASSRQRP